MFKRERRYIVIKGTDMAECMTANEQLGLVRLEANVNEWRRGQGKPPLDVFVVEADWPEFPIVIDMVRRRMEGLPTREAGFTGQIESLESEAKSLRAALQQACRRQEEAEAERNTLFSLLTPVFNIAAVAPELNPSNYDHDDVCALNTAMVEIHNILKGQVGEGGTILIGGARQPGMQTMQELAMLVKQLCRALAKVDNPNGSNKGLYLRALDYLKRKGLQGSPLREEAHDAGGPSEADIVVHARKWLEVHGTLGHSYPEYDGPSAIIKGLVEKLEGEAGYSAPWVTESTARVPRFNFVAKADGAYPREAAEGEWVKWTDHLAKLQELLKDHGDAALQEIDRLLDENAGLKERLAECERGRALHWTRATKFYQLRNRLAEAVKTAYQIAKAAPELNRSDINHDDACALDSAMVEVYQILKQAVECPVCNGVGEVTVTSGQTVETFHERNESCGTCNGRGEIGGLLPGDGGYQTDPCPDCSGKAEGLAGMRAHRFKVTKAEVGSWHTSFTITDMDSKVKMPCAPEALIHQIGSLFGRQLQGIEGLEFTINVPRDGKRAGTPNVPPKDMTLVVEAAMTETEKAAFLATFTKGNPHCRGAHVADVLDMLDDHDCHLLVTDTFAEKHGHEITTPRLLRLATYAVIYIHGDPKPAWETVKELADRVEHSHGR